MLELISVIALSVLVITIGIKLIAWGVTTIRAAFK